MSEFETPPDPARYLFPLFLLIALLLANQLRAQTTTVFDRVLPATGSTGITAPAVSANVRNRGQVMHLLTAIFPTAAVNVTGLEVRIEASYDNTTFFPISRDITGATSNGTYAVAIERANAAYPYVRARAVTVNATYPMLLYYTGSSEPIGNVVFASGRIITSPPTTGDKATWGLCTGSNCVVGTNLTSYWINTRPQTINKCYIVAKTAPTGGPLTVDVNKNGTTSIFAAGSFALAAGSTAIGDTTAFSSAATLAEGDYLTIDIDAVGATIPGKDVVLTCTLQ